MATQKRFFIGPIGSCLKNILSVGLIWLVAAPIALAGESEAYQHLTERMDVYFNGTQPRMIESYMTPYPPGPDGTVERVGFIYDSALAVTALIARATPADMQRAKLICDAFLWYQAHDPVASDGRLRSAYMVDQDLTQATTADIANGFDTINTGNLTWTGIALLSYYEKVRSIPSPGPVPNTKYLAAAVSIGNFIKDHFRDPEHPGFYLEFRDADPAVDITIGLPIAKYVQLTPQSQEVSIPLTDFANFGMDLAKLRSISMLFDHPDYLQGSVTIHHIKLRNATTGAELVIDDYVDTNRFANSLGFLVGGTADFSQDPTGKIVSWDSQSGGNDFWYSRLIADPNQPPRFDATGYTHLVYTLSGASGGERFTIELKGYPKGQRVIRVKSTEHNIDAYVFFMRLYRWTRNSLWLTCAQEAKAFVQNTAWDATGGKFWAGTTDDYETLNQSNLTLDQQAWALLALGKVSQYGPALVWADATLSDTSDGFSGFDFGTNINQQDPWYSPNPDGVWFEGTGQMVCAYQVSKTYGGIDFSDYYLQELDRAQTEAQNNNDKSLVAASHDELTTGYPFYYFASGAISATSWYIAGKRHVNPYWNTSTGKKVPYDVAIGPAN